MQFLRRVVIVNGCWDVLGGCQGVAMQFLRRVVIVNGCWGVLGGCQGVAMQLLRHSECFPLVWHRSGL